MRIRTMLKRKMKLIWKEKGSWLVSALPGFPPNSSAEAVPGEMGMFPVESHLWPSAHWNKTLDVFRTP